MAYTGMNNETIKRITDHILKHISSLEQELINSCAESIKKMKVAELKKKNPDYDEDDYDDIFDIKRSIITTDHRLKKIGRPKKLKDGRYLINYNLEFKIGRKNNDYHSYTKSQRDKKNEYEIIDAFLKTEIRALISCYPDIDGTPMEVMIDTLDSETTNIEFPMLVESVDQYLNIVKKRFEKFNLSKEGVKSLTEFLTFKYQTQIEPSEPHKKEGMETYYNLLLYGEEPENTKQFVKELARSLGYLDSLSELSASYYINNVKKLFFTKNDNIVHIYDCPEKPLIDNNTSAKERSSSVENLNRFNLFWERISQCSKENPEITFIVSMNDFVRRNTFMANNELYHRVFGHRIFIPELTIDQITDICMEELNDSSFDIADDFKPELLKYIQAIYYGADLKGFAFIKDLINRIYSYYFRRKIQDSFITPACIPPYPSEIGNVNSVLSELNKLSGLNMVKEQFKKIYISMKADPDNNSENFFHMMFYGNPGTGKTTVAKLAAEMLCQSGVIKTNKCKCFSIADVVSQYIAGTPRQLMDKIQESLDGVMFIDEAYGLTMNDHGREALNILIQAMLEYKDRLVVILAGYKDEMEKLLEVNPGLKSRIAYKLYFEDFSVVELIDIFKKKCSSRRFSLDPSAENTLRDCISARKAQDHDRFGNGRYIEELIRSLTDNWASEYYERMESSPNHDVQFERVFCDRHFKGLMPEKNMPYIDDMVGMKTVKDQLAKFRKRVEYLQYLRNKGMNNIPKSPMHMVFMGNPGTGKTTVARSIADDLYSLGVLKSNHLVQIESKDIISGYSAVSSKNMDKFIKRAIGGVLFIDEAYSLADGGTGGIEAVQTLLTAMVDHRDDTVFIFAGYPNEMHKFLKMNPGIPSRIGYTFVFEDYSTDELMEIFKKKMSETELIVAGDALPKVRNIMEFFREMPRFGNGRFVEKVVSQIIFKKAENGYKKNNYNHIGISDIPEIGELIETDSSGLNLVDPGKITKDDKLRTAYHELGHAIALCILNPSVEIKTISVKNHAFSLGRVSIERDWRNKTENELKNEIAMLLSGRSAERVFLGNCDTGCSSDYERAQSIARQMLNDYGMCEIGITKEADLLRQGDKDATELIMKYQGFIEKYAKKLVDGEEFTGKKFKSLVEKYMKG